MNWMTLGAAGVLLAGFGLDAVSAESKLFQEFKRDQAANKVSVLPDFSYAGYRAGVRAPEIRRTAVFNVTDYGAEPDDDIDDLPGIQKAVDAAEAAGGGVVFLPRGRYVVNTDRKAVKEINVTSSDIVIKGEGASADGTVIHQVHAFRNGDMNDPTRMHLKKSLFNLRSKIADRRHFLKQPRLAGLASPAPRGGFEITVDDASKLRAGDFVALGVINKAVIEELMKPYQLEPEWKTTTENRAPSAELHRIAAVSGNRVTFEEPLRYDLNPEMGWALYEFKPIENVGIEDILFVGNSYAPYYHHRSDRDDVGWAFVKMKGTDSSWVRRCVFVDANQVVQVSLSRYPTLMNLVTVGNSGHHIPRSTYFNYGLLGGFFDDRAGYTHGPSVSWGSVGTVFWRCDSEGAPDSHAGRPYLSLYDCNSGGRISSSGGLRDYPQHLPGLVLWNFRNTAPGIHYDFWKRGKNNRFVNPVIVGFHGEKATFEPGHVGVMESQGSPVEPESLYEAQLALRLGRLPEWVDEARATAKAMKTVKIPEHFDFKTRSTRGYQYVETGDLDELIAEQCELSLFMYGTVPFKFVPNREKLAFTGDHVMLAHTVYMLMNVLARENTKSGNSISARAEARGGVPGAEIILTSGPLGKKRVKLDSAPWFAAAQWMTGILGGELKTAEVRDDGRRLEIRLWVPLSRR